MHSRRVTAELLLACIAFDTFGDYVGQLADIELNCAYARLCALLVAMRDGER
jgi:hypothetical protein